MIINREKGWLVVTPPKTGSCTLNRLLCLPAFGGGFYAEGWHHNTEVPAWAQGFRVYLSVRDPFARAVSFYRWHLMDLWNPERITPFAEFVRRVLIGRDGQEFYWKTLRDWWPGEATPLRLESLAIDLVQLGPSRPFTVPLENPHPSFEPWAEEYRRDDRAAGLVAEWARADCERFGYSNSGQSAVGSGQWAVNLEGHPKGNQQCRPHSRGQ